TGYAASDRIPEHIAAMVYVDSGPATGALDSSFDAVEKPLVWEEIEAEENLDGLSEEQKETFRQRAVPEPGDAIRGSAPLTNDARPEPPPTAIGPGSPSGQYKAAIDEAYTGLGGFKELRDINWVAPPTSHWPMWSRTSELAQIIGDVSA